MTAPSGNTPWRSPAPTRWAAIIGATRCIRSVFWTKPNNNSPPRSNSIQRALALNALGRSHLRRGDCDGALALFERAAALNFKRELTQNNLGLFYLQKREAERAVACLRRATELAPSPRRATSTWASRWPNKARSRRPVAAYAEGLRLNPDGPSVAHQIAQGAADCP